MKASLQLPFGLSLMKAVAAKERRLEAEGHEEEEPSAHDLQLLRFLLWLQVIRGAPEAAPGVRPSGIHPDIY